MNFVDEQNRLWIGRQLLDDRFQALFEVAAILGTGKQSAHVEREYRCAFQHIRHAAFHDASRQTFRDGGFADSGFSDQQGIVLASTAQGLNDTFQFLIASDQGVNLAGLGLQVEIAGESVQRRGGFLVIFLLLVAGFAASARSGFLGRFCDSVRNEVDHIQSGQTLLGQKVQRMRILFAKNRDQHIGAGDFFLAGGLHMQYRALYHALEAQGRLRVHIGLARDSWCMAFNEISQFLA